MKKMGLVLVLSFGSVALGYLVQRFVLGRDRNTDSKNESTLPTVAKWIKLITLIGLLPWPILFTFWRVTQVSSRFIVIPLLGITSLIVGGVSATLFIRSTRMEAGKAGSLFSCGMMTNLGVIGGLIGLLFFGTDGYLTVQLFTMLEVLTYYLVVFPLAQQIGRGSDERFRIDFRLLISKPMSLIPLAAIIVGFSLRSFAVPAPDFLDRISAVLVPSVTGLIGFAIGLTLKVSKIHEYRRESTMIAAIKFLIIPAVIIPLAALLGVPSLLDGTAFRMIVILSFSPVGLIAMVPPQLYDLDLNLSNSGWFVTTVIHLAIVPILLFLVA